MTGVVVPYRVPALRRRLVVESEATIPTWHGEFRCVVFRYDGEPLEHVALVRGDITGHDVLVRVHSECLTSEAFGSVKCDCASQLDLGFMRIAAEGRGALVYLRQEGRGIGLADKIRAYALQATGLDTIDANRALDLPDDARRYDAAAAILTALGVQSIRLMTNNPDKLESIGNLGVIVRGRVPHVVHAHSESAGYLDTKRRRMGHLLPE